MPGRKYDLVCGDEDKYVKPPHLKREKVKKNGSVISDSETMSEKSGSYVCEVVKSPRAPQYEIHYVKTRKHGIQLVRKKPKLGRRFLQKKRPPGDQHSVTNTEDEETIASETTEHSQDDNMVGLRVIACNRHDGLYYSGTVSHTPDSAFAIVTFTDKKRQKVRTQMIIPMSGAIARPELAPGDFVLVRVYNQTIDQECYVPGIVEVTPEDFRQHNKFYSVLLYNGQRETTMRKLIVKIGRARFEMAIRYITHLQQQKILRDKQALSDTSALTSPQSTSTKKSDDETLSQQSSQSGRGRRKKDKLTKKLKKEPEKTRKSKRKSRSRSRSGTNSSVSSRSNSRASSGSRSSKASSRSKSSKASSRSSSSSKSRSRSRSRSKSRSRSRSRSRSTTSRSSNTRSDSSRTPTNTPRRKSSQSRRRTSSRSSSRSRSPAPKKSSRRKKTTSRSSSNSSWSRSKSRSTKNRSSTKSRSSRSRSRSSSSSSTVRSRSSEKKLKKGKSSRTRTRSPSGSSRSRSRGSVKSCGSSTPRAKSPYQRPSKPEPRSRSESKDESKDESRTESKTGSRRSVRRDIYYERNSRSTDYMQSDSRMTDASRVVNVDEKDEMIQTLQHQLEKQKRKQIRQEMRLVRQARKINKIQRKMRHSTDSSQNESVNSSHAEKSDREKSVQSSYSETDTSPRRRKGSPDGTSYQETYERVNAVGRAAPDSVVEQEVLARWTDDGWYYMGYVIGEKGDQQYIVKDNTGYMEVIDREDILTNVEHRFNAIQPEDYVIGVHPKYVFSFAPAEVMSTYSNNCVKVEFFDSNLAELASDDVYKISKSKYDEVVDYIKKCEKRMIGKSVVAREDNSGLYKLGVVDSRVGLGQQFYIKWLDGDMSKQNSNHIFEVGKPQTNHEQWYYVLAPTSHNNATYMPAEIIQTRPLTLQLADGRRTAEVTLDQCFWISKEYYTNARALILDIKQRR